MRPDEQEFGIDDLIEGERRELRLILVVLVLAMIFVGGKSFMEPEGAEGPQSPPPEASLDVPR